MGISFSKDLKDRAKSGETMFAFGLQTTSNDGQRALLGSKSVVIEDSLLPKNAAKMLDAVRKIWADDQADREAMKKSPPPEKKTETTASTPPAGATK